MLFGFAGRAHQNLVLGRARLLGSGFGGPAFLDPCLAGPVFLGPDCFEGPVLEGPGCFFGAPVLGGPDCFRGPVLSGPA